MVHRMALPGGLSPYSTFQKKLSDNEMNGDEAQLMQELEDPGLVLDVSCIHVFTHTVLCAFIPYLFFSPQIAKYA